MDMAEPDHVMKIFPLKNISRFFILAVLILVGILLICSLLIHVDGKHYSTTISLPVKRWSDYKSL